MSEGDSTPLGDKEQLGFDGIIKDDRGVPEVGDERQFADEISDNLGEVLNRQTRALIDTFSLYIKRGTSENIEWDQLYLPVDIFELENDGKTEKREIRIDVIALVLLIKKKQEEEAKKESKAEIDLTVSYNDIEEMISKLLDLLDSDPHELIRLSGEVKQWLLNK